METFVTQWLIKKNTDLWQEGTEKLIQQCDKCLNCGVEKEWGSSSVEYECYWS
jgi:hypothetical protein